MDSASLAMESHKTHQYYKGKVDRANTRFEGLNNRVGRNEGKNLFFSVTIARSKGTQLRNVTDYMVSHQIVNIGVKGKQLHWFKQMARKESLTATPLCL